MIGIVLVTHGNLAREFVSALEHVVGPQQCISAVCIGAEDDMEKRRAEILERARACDTGEGVILLTDMFGGTPSNLAISIMEQARIEVLAGVNLPMLVKLSSVRNRPIAEAIAVNLREMAALDTPIIVVVHGEGGSGGALGLAIGDRILMSEFAVYSVIPPEGCAAILWRNSGKKVEAAVPMRRLGSIEEFASFCANFIDGSFTFTTGQFVAFAGGWV